jgi:phosphate transport system permease protein
VSDSPYENWKRGVRRTPRCVRVTEWVARAFITAGGLGTICAVALIMVFLLYVVVPLFSGGHSARQPAVALSPEAGQPPIIQAGVDASMHMGWTLRADGRLVVRRLSDGDVLAERTLFDGVAPSAWAFSPDAPRGEDGVGFADGVVAAFGFSDGTVRLGTLLFLTSYLPAEVLSSEAQALRVGAAARHEDGIVEVTPTHLYRWDHLVADFGPPVQVSDAAIELLDYSVTSGGRAVATMDATGTLAISSIEERHNLFTDEIEAEVYPKPLEYEQPTDRGRPDFIRMSGVGNTLHLLWKDGHALRYDARGAAFDEGLPMGPVEELDMAPEGSPIAYATFLVGKTTLVLGHENGRLRAWFPTRPADAFARDGVVTTPGHVLAPQGTAVTALVPSRNTRQLVSAYADGTVRIHNITNEALLAEVESRTKGPIAGVGLAPQLDGLVLFGDRALESWRLDLAHPEATLASLFGQVWYEGSLEPAHFWQSEGGSDDFEPKLSLIPLIFGTLKAALYSMLIAGPIAILAALFTSEFLSPRWRTPIKSVIEMMASLPSVVLGFLAAIVLAPFVDSVLMTVLCMALTLPLAILVGARLWQLLPQTLLLRLSGAPRLLAIALLLPLSLLFASLVAGPLEALCFGGNLKAWLAGRVGTSFGGWTFLLLPVGLMGAGLLIARFSGPWLRRASSQWSHARCARLDLARFGVVIVGGAGIAVLLAGVFSGALGWDPRSSFVGPYEPRNAMIVGFVMGFAIVPIIYTLAEDALSSVPEQLREGSLGCGATPWQTAWRIVLPTAMSGVFSALMMGLGRAVGETMIVLMAAGNTPIMDWNAFNGFRTLSANIATELPEAVQGSTHYRVLFLAALVLFSITFVINGVAELVRRHFRKRFADL